MWKEPDCTYVGEAIPGINQKQHSDFVKNYQAAIFQSLLERKLLTREQYEECIEELEYQRGEST